MSAFSTIAVEVVLDLTEPVDVAAWGAWANGGTPRPGYRASSVVARTDAAGRVSVRFGGSLHGRRLASTFQTDDPALAAARKVAAKRARDAWLVAQ